MRYGKNKHKMIKKRTVSVDKIKKDLDFSPVVSIHEGLKKTVDWLDGNINKVYR